MTAQETHEYKVRWMSSGNNNPVQIHSDLADEAKSWCRRNLERCQWRVNTWTDVYAHTFYFENMNHSQQFEQEFKDWIKKED